MIKRKIYIISALAIFVLVFLAVFTYSYFKQLPPRQNPVIITTELMTKAQLQSDTDNYNQAVEKNDIGACDSIKDAQSRDFCVKEVASFNNDSDDCSLIHNEIVQADCLTDITLNKAVETSSLPDCEKIASPMAAQTCIERIAIVNKASDCKLLTNGDFFKRCLSITYYEQAKASNDVNQCYMMPDLVLRANCLSEISKIDLHSDTDKDGLDFLQEILNSSDPDLGDTDKDGHGDKEELANGFAPNGEGKINEEIPSNSILCRDIEDSKIQNVCLLELKDKPLNYLKCNDIQNLTLKNFCFTLLAKSKK